MNGLLGPNYLGTWCFFSRRVFFGGPSHLLLLEMPQHGPKNVLDKPIQSQEVLELAHHVAGCNYGKNTTWGLEVSYPRFLLYVYLCIGAYGQDLLDFVLAGGTFHRWWNDQRMWMIRGLSSFLFGTIEFSLKSLGIASHGFNVTSKVLNEDQSKRYEQGSIEFGVSSPLFVPLAMAAIVNLVAFAWGNVELIRGSNSLEELFMQMCIASFGILNCKPHYYKK
ncbi:unnamed protein product [Prunus armeniaca]|uniref:Uncharacterized protein n=1 Tax=Prunus armeniaca TaxID=36596 RepID=A0A6J5UU81_PRUAR|nr:unnamed protein product [Prunus armeniaca]